MPDTAKLVKLNAHEQAQLAHLASDLGCPQTDVMRWGLVALRYLKENGGARLEDEVRRRFVNVSVS